MALGVAGVLYRIILVAFEVPLANSDEGTAGIAALHIAAGREYPIFFYGQAYLGALQSYVAAPLVSLVGPAWWPLRVPPLLCYAGFLLLSYKLTARLYTPWFAVLVVGLLAFGSDHVIEYQLVGAGGYAEMLPAVTGLILVTVLLAQRQLRYRLLGFAAWGGLVGFIAWTHWLALPYVAVAGVLLVGMCWRELRGRAGLVVVAAAVVGAAPLLVYNLTAAENSFTVFRSISKTEVAAPLLDRLYGAVMLGLPLTNGLCAPGVCSPAQLWWGPVYVVLLVVAGVLVSRGWWHAVRAQEPDTEQTAMQAGRLALLVAAALTLMAYIASAYAATSPMVNGRYLHYSLASLPAVLWPLWLAVSQRRRPVVTATAGLVLLLFASQLMVATGALVRQAPAIAAQAREERELVSALDRLHIHHIYSEYWTCNRLAYVSKERVVCAVLNKGLVPGLDRYAPYRERVESAQTVFYVFPVRSIGDQDFSKRLAEWGTTLPVRRVGGYHIYGPTDRHISH